MKVLIGHFTSESNMHVPNPCDINDYVIKYGEDLIDAMQIRDIFEEEGIELIPAIYANGYSAGTITKEAFQYIASKMLRAVKEHAHEIDGIFLFLHGASNVEDLEGGSGDHYLLREIRKIVGPYMPISVTMDPHGNLTKEFAKNCTICRCYRQSPHTDMFDTYRIVAKMLVDVIKNRRNIHAVYRKPKLILGGERSVSTDEPMLSINNMLDEIEKDERIMSCSFHIGYVRHDNACCGTSVIVVPNTEADFTYANEIADKIENYVFEKRKEFHFTGTALEPGEAVTAAVSYKESPVFIMDSGDNSTSGSAGADTYVLRQFLNLKDYNNKRILFAAICDTKAIKYLLSKKQGDFVEFDLGMNYNEYSEPVEIKGKISKIGYVQNILGGTENVGDCVTVSVNEKPIDVLVSSSNISYAEIHQYEAANLNICDYDIIIVKQGYIFPEIKAMSKLSIMSLTKGATDQKVERITFKKVMRPMFPLDET